MNDPDLGQRLKAAIQLAERVHGGKADHVRIDRDGHISVTTRREEIAPVLARAFNGPDQPERRVSRGAVPQGTFDELLDQLPRR